MAAVTRVVPDEAKQQYLELIESVSQAIPDGTSFPLVLNVALALMEEVVRNCDPSGRALVLRGIRATIDLIEADHPARPH